ncbi:ankyrin repeat domain-containing protein 16-like isoform X1 [Montipora capricornis]|uniref:ankyrin repeat domain-containing protein 16-like isoform X1 n=1 Tax=Montipora capricornis TaxID=246305 RepID=UPI0035F18F53
MAGEVHFSCYENFPDYPPPLRLVQRNKLDEFIAMVDNSQDKRAILNCVHSKSGDTALIVAARQGHFDLIKFLIESGVDVEQRNKDLKRALHEAAAGSHVKCVKVLISYKAEIDCLKRADWTPLMMSCTKPNIDTISLLVQSGANMKLTNKDGWNCFHVAAREGHTDILCYLLDCCAGIWDTCSKNGRTPLHTAALHGKTEAVRLMISRCGYIPDSPDSCGLTPLMDALRAGFIQVAEILVTEHKACVRKKDKLGRQAMHLAARTGCNVSLDYLITNFDADVDMCTENSDLTPLHLAAKEGCTETVQFLLDRGARINSQDRNGRTALHLSSAAGHEGTVDILLRSYKADNNIKDCFGKKAEDYALKPAVRQNFGLEPA